MKSETNLHTAATSRTIAIKGPQDDSQSNETIGSKLANGDELAKPEFHKTSATYFTIIRSKSRGGESICEVEQTWGNRQVGDIADTMVIGEG